jgi:hypothetical protein
MKKRKPATSRGEGGTNIVQAEQSFNRKLSRVRVQRKQVVFTTVATFLPIGCSGHAEGIPTTMLL